MRTNTTRGSVGVAALVLIVFIACTTSPAAPAHVQTSPKATVHTLAGGCAGTTLTDAEPPVWAQSGWSVAKGAPWPVPWASGTNGDAVAYVFATQLVAGSSPRVEDSSAAANVSGHPLGKSQPVVTIAGGPSITDVPTAECWTFLVTWGSSGQHSSTINLEVLPAGTLP